MLGVITAWTPPDGVLDVEPLEGNQIEAIKQLVKTGMVHWASKQSADWAGNAVASVLRLSLKDPLELAMVKAKLVYAYREWPSVERGSQGEWQRSAVYSSKPYAAYLIQPISVARIVLFRMQAIKSQHIRKRLIVRLHLTHYHVPL